MSYHVQSAQSQSALYRVLRFSCVVSHLSEHHGKDKSAPPKPLPPSQVLLWGIRSVPHLDVANMCPFDLSLNNVPCLLVPLDVVLVAFRLLWYIPRWRQHIEQSIYFAVWFQRDRIHSWQGWHSMAVGTERWVIISSTQRKEREGMGGWSTGSGGRHTSPIEEPHKDSIAWPNSATNRGPVVQTHEPMKDMSHLNQYR